MKSNFKFSILPVLLFVAMGCQKNEEGVSINRFGIDPMVNVDALNKVLQMEGHYYDSLMPTKKLILGNDDYTLNTDYDIFIISEGSNKIYRPGDQISIPFSLFIKYPGFGIFQLDPISSLKTLKIYNAFLKVKGASGHWRLPIQSVGLRYYINFKIPKFVKEGDFTFSFTVGINGVIDGKMVNAIPGVTTTENTKIYSCNDSISDKGEGLHFYNFDLGEKPGRVSIRCRLTAANSLFASDRVDVKYNDIYVASTGKILPIDRYPVCKQGSDQGDGFLYTWVLPGHYKELVFNYNPTVSKNVKVQVFGSCNDGNSEFSIIVKCPK